MADPAPKHIEEQLRQHAAQRRAATGGEFTLHPATRRLLQGEVARTYATAPATSTPERRFWPVFWRRLAFVGCFGLLAVVVMQVNQRQGAKETTQDLAAPTADAMPLAVNAPAGAPGAEAQPTVAEPAALTALRRDEVAPPVLTASGAMKEAAGNLEAAPKVEEQRRQIMPQRQLAEATTSSRLPASPAASPPPASLPVGRAEREAARGGSPVGAKTQPGVVAPAELAKQEAATLFSTSGGGSAVERSRMDAPPGGQVYTQRFGQDAFRANLQSPPRPAVLNQFTVRLSGQVLQIVDQDGSVYEGQFIAGTDAYQPAERSAAAPAVQRKVKETKSATAAPALGGTAPPASAGYQWSFRVAGTNRTVNQPVTLEGVFFQEPAAPASPAPAEASPTALRLPGGAASLPTLPLRGRARIGGQQEVIIDAVPAGR